MTNKVEYTIFITGKNLLAATLMLLLVFLIYSPLLYAQDQPKENPTAERILSFKSYIKINHDGSLSVTENIVVNSNQKKILHGIYRDFPTVYRGGFGTIFVPFRVISLQREGIDEAYHLSSLQNGVRIYFGNISINLPSGNHTYVLNYFTNHQLGYFENYDELYWNVTGNAWEFPIDFASAEIELPKGAKIIQSAAYTGYQGQKGKDYKTYINEHGNTVFETTKPLAVKEGLTIAVGWSKGFVDKNVSFFTTHSPTDPIDVVIALVSLILMVIYSYIFRPASKYLNKGTIIPLFEPPAGISPAFVNYIYFKKSDSELKQKALGASILDMAVKGYLKIMEDKSSFTLNKNLPTNSEDKNDQSTNNPTNNSTNNPNSENKSNKAGLDFLSKEEQVLASSIFAEGENFKFSKITPDSEINEQLKMGFEEFRKNLIQDCKTYFSTHYLFVIFGFVFALIFLMIILAFNNINFMFQYIVTLGVLFACLFFRKFLIFFIFLLIMGMLNISRLELMIQNIFIFDLNNVFVLIFSALMLAIALSHWSMKTTYNQEGRALADKIEGFKLFLSVTEKERYKLLQAPEVTTEIFEKYLPFAVALGVETKWASALAKGFTPLWYEGSRNAQFMTVNRMPSSIKAFSSALNTAALDAMAASQYTSISSSAPGSSSGSGGGGSSGGGGGGGGGGGW